MLRTAALLDISVNLRKIEKLLYHYTVSAFRLREDVAINRVQERAALEIFFTPAASSDFMSRLT